MTIFCAMGPDVTYIGHPVRFMLDATESVTKRPEKSLGGLGRDGN
jgi:hypothetical protein